MLDHDFPSWAIGRAIPYGIYDLAFDDGFVVVGTSHETPSFAVAAIRRWWMEVGRRRYSRPAVADRGGRGRGQRRDQVGVEGGVAGPGGRVRT